MKKFTAREVSEANPNPNRECLVVIEQVGRSQMGTITFEDTSERIGPVTLIGFDRKQMKATLRKPDRTSAEFTVTKILES